MTTSNKNTLNKEFQEFLDCTPSQPPIGVSKVLSEKVHKDLNPPIFKVFTKLSLIHFFTSLVTLSVCPQFGFRVLGQGMGLVHIFEVFGKTGCTFACGSFFLGMSLFVSALTLRPEEIRSIRSHRLSELTALALISLGFFIMINVDFVLSISLVWMLGSLIGGIGFLEIGWFLRKKITL